MPETIHPVYEITRLGLERLGRSITEQATVDDVVGLQHGKIVRQPLNCLRHTSGEDLHPPLDAIPICLPCLPLLASPWDPKLFQGDGVVIESLPDVGRPVLELGLWIR